MITRRTALPIAIALLSFPARGDLPATAMRAMRMQQWRQAAVALREARELDPADAEVAARLGAAYTQMGHYADALSPFEDAQGTVYYENNGIGAHATALRELGRHAGAAELRRGQWMGAETDSKQLVVLLEAADDRMAAGDSPGAIDLTWQALSINPDSPMGLAWMADIHAQRGEADEAGFYLWLNELQGAGMARGDVARARIALADDAPLEALDAVLSARNQRRRNADFALLQAEIYRHMGWLHDARDLLDRQQVLYGDDPDWAACYGQVLWALGERAAACEILADAASTYRHRPEASALLAQLGCPGHASPAPPTPGAP
jgi:predicted Zn-dependent protease